MTAMHPALLLEGLDPARPLITFYDDATGERIELSAKTFGNWVAKTSNLLVDGLDAAPGEEVALLLPPHWQTAVWIFAAWSAGLAVRLGDTGDTGDAAVVAVTGAGLTGEYPDAREIVGLSLHALGMPLTEKPGYVVDYAAEVRGYADRFTPTAALDPKAPALTIEPASGLHTYDGTSHRTAEKGVMSITLPGEDVVSQSREAAARWGLDARSRVLVDVGFGTLPGLLAGLIAPIHAGGSVIICRNLNKASIDRRVTVEHVTAVAGVSGWDGTSGSVARLT